MDRGRGRDGRTQHTLLSKNPRGQARLECLRCFGLCGGRFQRGAVVVGVDVIREIGFAAFYESFGSLKST